MATVTAATTKSLFERFSYSKKREVLVHCGASVNQSKQDSRAESEAIESPCTPNNAHLTSSVAETPDSSIKRKRRRRRRARISSSSEDSLVPLPQPDPLSKVSAGLDKDMFCGLPVSKRCKKEVNVENKPSNIPRRRKTLVKGWGNEQPFECHRPRKLVTRGCVTTEDEDDEELISSLRKQKTSRKRVVNLSSGSSESLPIVCPTTLGAGGKACRVQRGRFPAIIVTSDDDDEDDDGGDGEARLSSRLSKKAVPLQPNGLSVRSKLLEFSFKEGVSNRRNAVRENHSLSQKASSVVTSRKGTQTHYTDMSDGLADQLSVRNVSSSQQTTGIPEKCGSSGKEGCTSSCLQQRTPNILECLDSLSESDVNSESDDDYSDGQKVAILEFLNESSLEQLCDVPGCSLTKAKLLNNLRPFQSWDQMTDSMVSTKKLTHEAILDGCFCLLEERKLVEKLLSRCQAISASIQSHLSSIPRVSGNVVQGVLRCYQQPAILSSSVQLKPYQLEGLNWITLLHSQDLNGILADEMGLGKTMQAIAFLAHLFENGSLGPFLIVVPTSTIDNWARELEKWCPSLKVLVYYGSAAERYSLRSEYLSGEDYHVILSTYKLCISQIQDRKFFRKFPLECIILDEGHMLKNMSSQRYSNFMKIRAKRRLLLTGTPIQNNLLELMSLLSFIMPNIFRNFIDSLKKTFSRKMKESSAYYRDQVTKAQKIMQPFILRRLKAEVLQQLAAKVEETVFLKMADLQLQLYSTAVHKSRRELATFRIGCAGKENDLENSLSVITTLRKIAMHPLLLRHHYHDNLLKKMARAILKEPAYHDADSSIVYEDMTVMTDFELHDLCTKTKALTRYSLPHEYLNKSSKFNYLTTKLEELKELGSRVLLFSQLTMMLDVLEAFLQSHGHTFLRLDGSTPIAERLGLIDKYNSDSKIFIFLLSTKAGGIGINLSSANVVILHDIDFNPYNDKQAEDRCHRVGQTREVSVLRLICKDTIEEDILQCAEKKLQLEKDINQIQTDGLSGIEVASVLT